MQIEFRHPLWLLRAIVGAVLVVAGFLFFKSNSEGLGLTLILTGIVIGIRGTFAPMVTLFVCITYVFVVVTYFYWVIPEEYDYGYDEWFAKNWWMYAWFGLVLFISVFSMYQRNSDTWKALRKSYSESPKSLGEKDRYPAQFGLLKIDEEFMRVKVIAGKDGLFVAKENDGHIFFPWSRLREIRISDANSTNALVEVSRKNMNPLRMSVPWNPEMLTEVPSEVRIARH